MKKLRLILLAGITTITAVSCSHKESAAPARAELTITQPAPNQAYRPGEAVNISGTISGYETMHGYKVCIINSNGDSLCKRHNHTHASRIDINESWTDSTGSGGLHRIIISSAINHEGDEVKKEILVRILP